VFFLKITGHALFQADRFAHVQELVLRIKVSVHARQGGQGGNLLQQLRRMAGGYGLGLFGHLRIVDNLRL
jgi:hypothetical protein